MSRLRLIAIAALALAFALPGTVLAATVDVAGTATLPGGGPAAGVEILVLVQGTDQIVPTKTDANGAWALQVDADAGSVLEISATGATTRSKPDAKGCVTLTTPTARVTVTIETLPLAAIDFPLDGAITSTECTAIATPHPVNTPPSTDSIAGGGSSPGSGTALVILALAGCSSLVLAAARRRPHGRSIRR